ncbi:hypothetical protein PVK06_016614 [Gossypium arboreum]|uniref:Uncharacterized protein n=1 Tax=Gossypium arboreum TaxID=29729 RepID=A0ABR0Q0P1_GOSAR|nr:hypothetical protein PVK06_016614 [Gossypium arboreum]
MSSSHNFDTSIYDQPARSNTSESLFNTPTGRNRYDRLRHKQLVPYKCLSLPVLDVLHLATVVTTYFRNSGWIGNFDIAHCAYYELVLEFYSAFHFQRHIQISLDTPGVVKFWLLDLYVACQVDLLDARYLDLMGLLLGTPSSFCFVAPSVRSTPAEQVFRLQNQNEIPTQAQPSMTIEQRLERIEARLDTFGQQLAELIVIIRERQ